DLSGRETCGICRLEPGVREPVAPAIPSSTLSRIREGRIAGALVRHALAVALASAAERPSRHELCERLLLRIVEILALRLHRPGRQRFVNAFGRHLANRVWRWRTFDGGIAVTAGA